MSFPSNRICVKCGNNQNDRTCQNTQLIIKKPNSDDSFSCTFQYSNDINGYTCDDIPVCSNDFKYIKKSESISETSSPSVSPTIYPTVSPTLSPTKSPTKYPTILTIAPTISPTKTNDGEPEVQQTTETPTLNPTQTPSISPIKSSNSVNNANNANNANNSNNPNTIIVLDLRSLLIIIFCIIGCCMGCICIFILIILIRKTLKSKEDIDNLRRGTISNSNTIQVTVPPSIPSSIPSIPSGVPPNVPSLPPIIPSNITQGSHIQHSDDDSINNYHDGYIETTPNMNNDNNNNKNIHNNSIDNSHDSTNIQYILQLHNEGSCNPNRKHSTV